MNSIKYLNFTIIFLLLISIQGCQNTSKSNQTPSECPSEPTVKLQNIKNVELTSKTTIIDDKTASNNPIGYRFTAKKGQRLMYKIKTNNICLWIYDSNNKLIDSPILPENGTYILQIASSEGSGTFQLELSINDSVAIKTSVSPLISIQPSPKVTRPLPEEAIKNYYQLINNRDIDASWKDLSDSFKGSDLTKGEKKYREWWGKVKNTDVNSITLIRQDQDRATVRAVIRYTLKTGRVVDDDRTKIYLIWDNNNKKWLINDKR
jgi:hypothetical protein